MNISPQHPEKWDETVAFLQEVVNVLLDYIKDLNDRSSKILEFHHPDEMKKLIDLSTPRSRSRWTSCQEVLKLGVKTGHPRFFNQISCGLDLVSMAGEWLTATANTNMFTYEISPLYILMEKEVMRKMIDLIGWPADKGDGTFTPGGAIANMYAMNVARHQYYPRIKSLGMSGSEDPLLLHFRKCSHYSIKGSAATLGIGADYCFCIESDKQGRMIPEALEKKIVECKKEGLVPFFVVATAGTTVYGAFDPLPQIADICDRHKLWFHVDAAWGGGLLLSPEHRHKLTGLDRASSVTWNPHKLMGCLLQCSACFIKQDGLLFQCNQMSADYLFQQDKPYDVSYDTGDKVIQCGRHNDIFKFWLMWRSKGMEGYRKQINRLMELTAYFTNRIKHTPGYEMVVDKVCCSSLNTLLMMSIQPEFLNICFWYVPPSLRHLDLKEKNARLEKIAPKIKARMMERGTTMVGYQPDKQRPNFFRMIISNQAITEEDLDFLVDEIVEIGHDL
ncbi:Glutamate decarboxylase 1 [Aphelenchoides fujianensis]|nr:Glutamate decarboxylase 1 [Aphelenchoides fujianensis]